MSVSLKDRKVLVVDDDLENCKLIEEALAREGAKVHFVRSGAEALEECRKWQPQLVLLDQDMPGMSGLETLLELRRQGLKGDVLFISANSSAQFIGHALESGADDYIRKPFSFRELVARLKVRVRLQDLVNALEEANMRLADLSQKDDLTGLYNMRSMYDRIDHEIKRTKRSKGQVACVMLDMDHFKKVNDGHDHLFGSFVLGEVGKILRTSIREVDFAARYGGDEFLLVLTDTTEEGTGIFAERLREKVARHLFTDGKDEIRLTVSMGFAVSGNLGDIDARELVRRADHALYAAKEQGRNRVIASNERRLKVA